MTESVYHIPVMLAQCTEGLAIDPNGIYVDVTFGGGGHSREILKQLDKGHLYGFDQDQDAEANIPADPKFTFVQANFIRLHRMQYTVVAPSLADKAYTAVSFLSGMLRVLFCVRGVYESYIQYIIMCDHG